MAVLGLLAVLAYVASIPATLAFVGTRGGTSLRDWWLS